MKFNHCPKLVVLSFIFGICLVGMASCKSTKETVATEPVKEVKGFAFDFVEEGDLQSVLDRAKREDKLVFIDVYATWCLPCKMMDRDVFTHGPTAEIINKDFISYKVDAEKDNGLKISFDYRVEALPTLLFLDTDGKELARETGAIYHNAFLDLAQLARDRASADK